MFIVVINSMFVLQAEAFIARCEGEHSRDHINTQGALPD